MYALVGGLSHHLLLLYWIIIVLGTYGGLNWFVSVQALLLLASYMSVYFAVFGFFAHTIIRSFPAAVALWLLPALWVGLDWLRGVLFTGIPWMDIGYALFTIPVLCQVADLVGHYGVTFLVVFINTLLFLLFTAKRTALARGLLLISACCLLTGVGWYSVVRLDEVSGRQVSAGERLMVGVVQGNIDQSVKWSPAQQKATVTTYLGLSEALLKSSQPAMIIWPETALPFFPATNDNMVILHDMIRGKQTALLSGAPWYEIIDREAKKVQYFNSALLLQPDGGYDGKYFKTHLVPFGEYVPLKKLLPFLAPLVEAVGDFSPGTIEKPLSWQAGRAGILICYESVFPELSRQWVKVGANMLVNLTNDAWYGKSSAPYHSLAMAVFRAVETRRSLVRSANTGISAFVLPSGHIVDQSPIFVPWAAVKEIVLSEEVTVWVRYGYFFAPVCLVIGCLGSILAMSRQRRRLAAEF